MGLLNPIALIIATIIAKHTIIIIALSIKEVSSLNSDVYIAEIIFQPDLLVP